MAGVATDTVDKVMKGRSGSLNTILEDAGVSTPAKDLIVIVGAAALAVFALGLVAGQPVVAVLLALMCPVVGRMLLSMLADRRRKQFGGQLDEILQMIAGSLRAGYSLPQAVATISQEAAKPVSTEFTRVTNEVRVGRSMMESLDDVAARMRNDDFYWVTQAIGINREVGGNLADVLDNVGKTIRQRAQMKRQVDALAADGRLSAIILMLLPFVVALFLFFLNPTYIMKLFTNPIGWVMLGAGVVMLTIGGLWMMKVINLKY
jgi:tight adherence protein B